MKTSCARYTAISDKTSDGILGQMMEAMGETPRSLAEKLKVNRGDIVALMGAKKSTASDMLTDEVWWKLSEYVAKQIGVYLAVRAELNKLLQSQRAERAERVRRLERTHGKA